MANKRIHYACKRVGIAPLGDPNFTTLRGLQTIGITTNFNLEQVFEIGQLAIYENIEGIPDVEVTTEKVLDGRAPLYTLATQLGTAPTLIGRSNARCSMGLAIYADDQVSASGDGQIGLELSGLYTNSVGYTIPVEGNSTESITLVGSNKVWKIGTSIDFADNPFAANDDAPTASGVQRRENIRFGDGGSRLPTEILGLTASGYNIADANGDFPAHITNVGVSTDLGREQMFELGRKGPYHRFVNFPVEVTTEVGVISISGDNVSATEVGIYGTTGTCGERYNLNYQTIIIKMCDSLQINCGTRNKLSSVGMGGGDAGGGNEELTYTYTNFNDFTVYHRNDPRAAESAFQPAGGW